MLSTQKGMRQQGQMPNTQRAPHRIQARALLSDLVLWRKGRYEREGGGTEYCLPGGYTGLTVVTGHVDRSVPEGGSLDVLDLGDDLGGGRDVLLLRVGRGHGSWRLVVGRRGTSLLWHLGVQSSSSHNLLVAGGSCWHLRKIQTY